MLRFSPPIILRPGWIALDALWFDTPGALIGVVLTHDEHAGHKAYIGVGIGWAHDYHLANGEVIPTDHVDARLIALNGGRVPNEVAQRLWPSTMNWAS